MQRRDRDAGTPRGRAAAAALLGSTPAAPARSPSPGSRPSVDSVLRPRGPGVRWRFWRRTSIFGADWTTPRSSAVWRTRTATVSGKPGESGRDATRTSYGSRPGRSTRTPDRAHSGRVRRRTTCGGPRDLLYAAACHQIRVAVLRVTPKRFEGHRTERTAGVRAALDVRATFSKTTSTGNSSRANTTPWRSRAALPCGRPGSRISLCPEQDRGNQRFRARPQSVVADFQGDRSVPTIPRRDMRGIDTSRAPR